MLKYPQALARISRNSPWEGETGLSASATWIVSPLAIPIVVMSSASGVSLLDRFTVSYAPNLDAMLAAHRSGDAPLLPG